VLSSAKLDTVTTVPPLPPVVVFTPSAGTAANPTRPDGLPLLVDELLEDELEELLEEELLLDEELAELEELELLLEDELLLELDEELLEDELEELEELLLDEELLLELDEELLEPPLGAEHSLTPPGTRVPAPKVASLQTKLPLSILKVNWSARPKATLVLAATLQVLFSVQTVT
jgi:hypothetical protein